MQQVSFCLDKASDVHHGLYSEHQQSRTQQLIDLPSVERMGHQKYPVTCPLSHISIIVVPSSEHHKAKQLAVATYQMLKKEEIDHVIMIAQSDLDNFHGVALPLNRKDTELFDGFEMNVEHVAELAQNRLFHYDESAYKQTTNFQVHMQFMHYYLDSSLKITPLLIGEINSQDANVIAKKIALLSDERTLILISADVTSCENFINQGMCVQSSELCVYQNDAQIIQALQGIPAGAQDLQLGCLRERNALILLLKILEQSKFKNIQSYFVGYDVSSDPLFHYEAESYASFMYQQRSQDGYENYLGSYEQSQLVQIAQSSLDLIFEPKLVVQPCMISYEMTQPHGAFVSLHSMSNHGRLLRGCMGHVQPKVPLYKLVADMTRQAACHDYRFYVLTHQEVKFTMVSISLVSNLQKIEHLEDIQRTDGIFFEYGDKSAISLPSTLPAYNWSYKDKLIDLCSQAGVSASAWSEPSAKISMFQSVTFQ